MEREPLSPEADALWRRLWEIWQDNDEDDVILGSSELQDLEDERAVITLGEWPDAGDTQQSRELPLQRELARVLEPWLLGSGALWGR